MPVGRQTGTPEATSTVLLLRAYMFLIREVGQLASTSNEANTKETDRERLSGKSSRAEQRRVEDERGVNKQRCEVRLVSHLAPPQSSHHPPSSSCDEGDVPMGQGTTLMSYFIGSESMAGQPMLHSHQFPLSYISL